MCHVTWFVQENANNRHHATKRNELEVLWYNNNLKGVRIENDITRPERFKRHRGSQKETG